MPLLTTTCLAERRATVRFFCSLDAFCLSRQTTGEACHEVRVQDISQTGVGLILDQPLESGTIVGIEMGYRLWRRPRVLMARVVHATAKPDGSWLVGCE